VTSIYRDNLAVLSRVDPQLASRVEQAEPAGRLLPTKEGGSTLEGVGEDGRVLLFHSRYAPAQEAARQVEGRFQADAVCYLLYGMGLGYLLRALYARSSKETCLVLLEPQVGVFRRALECFDWKGIFSSGRVFPLVGLDRVALFRRLDPLTLSLFLKTVVVEHLPSKQAYPESYRRLSKDLADFFSYSRMGIHTAAVLSSVTKLNMAMNLPDYLFAPGVSVLRSRAKGRPVLIVSAGPSLVKNIGLLPRACERAVCIAVDTVFKTLLRFGVRPDYVVTLDYSKISRKYFDGLPPDVDTVLVCDPKVSWAVVDAYRGPKLFTQGPYLDALLSGLPGNKGELPPGATVAHLAFALARYLEAEPILFVGQDLAYPYGITHLPGTPIHDAWIPELNLFQTVEMKEWEEILRIRGRLRRVEDIHGHSIYTDEQMDTYLQRFEREFDGCPVPVLDATEGGARKRGTQVVTLVSVLDSFVAPALDRSVQERFGSAEPDEALRTKGLEALGLRRQTLEAFLKVCERTFHLLKEIHRAMGLGNREKVSRLVRRMEEVKKEVRVHDEAFRLVAELVQADEYQRTRRDREIGVRGYQGDELQRKQLERDLAYVEGLKSGTQLLLSFVQVAEERLQAYPEKVAYTPG
jgi:hypothetical protein